MVCFEHTNILLYVIISMIPTELYKLSIQMFCCMLLYQWYALSIFVFWCMLLFQWYRWYGNLWAYKSSVVSICSYINGADEMVCFQQTSVLLYWFVTISMVSMIWYAFSKQVFCCILLYQWYRRYGMILAFLQIMQILGVTCIKVMLPT